MRTSLVIAMLAAGLAFSPAAQAHAPRYVRHARAYRPFRSAYHIPRFDQDEAEAEVHAQYFYRTPYLPYWVFP